MKMDRQTNHGGNIGQDNPEEESWEPCYDRRGRIPEERDKKEG